MYYDSLQLKIYLFCKQIREPGYYFKIIFYSSVSIRRTATASGTHARNVELEHPGTTPVVVVNQEISTDSPTNSATDSHPELPPAEEVTAVNTESAAGEELPTNSRSTQTFLALPLDPALLEHEWHETPWKDTTWKAYLRLEWHWWGEWAGGAWSCLFRMWWIGRPIFTMSDTDGESEPEEPDRVCFGCGEVESETVTLKSCTKPLTIVPNNVNGMTGTFSTGWLAPSPRDDWHLLHGMTGTFSTNTSVPNSPRSRGTSWLGLDPQDSDCKYVQYLLVSPHSSRRPPKISWIQLYIYSVITRRVFSVRWNRPMNYDFGFCCSWRVLSVWGDHDLILCTVMKWWCFRPLLCTLFRLNWAKQTLHLSTILWKQRVLL